MIPATDEEPAYTRSTFQTPDLFRGGCCFGLLLLGLLIIGRVAYVQITDHRAVAAAKDRCRQDRVLQVHQAAVWRDYLRQLPPTTPYGDFLIEMRRIRSVMGMRIDSLSVGDDQDLVLVNAKGEVARLSYVRAYSARFSIEGVPTMLFSCYDQSRDFYRYAYAF